VFFESDVSPLSRCLSFMPKTIESRVSNNLIPNRLVPSSRAKSLHQIKQRQSTYVHGSMFDVNGLQNVDKKAEGGHSEQLTYQTLSKNPVNEKVMQRQRAKNLTTDLTRDLGASEPNKLEARYSLDSNNQKHNARLLENKTSLPKFTENEMLSRKLNNMSTRYRDIRQNSSFSKLQIPRSNFQLATHEKLSSFPKVLPEIEVRMYYSLIKKFKKQDRHLDALAHKFKESDNDQAWKLARIRGMTGNAICMMEQLRKNCESPPEVDTIKKQFLIPQLNAGLSDDTLFIEIRKVQHFQSDNPDDFGSNLKNSQSTSQQYLSSGFSLASNSSNTLNNSCYVVIKLPKIYNQKTKDQDILSFRTKNFKSYDQIMHLEKVSTGQNKSIARKQQFGNFVKGSGVIFEIYSKSAFNPFKSDKKICSATVDISELVKQCTVERTVDLVSPVSSKTVGRISLKIALRKPLESDSLTCEEEFIYLKDRMSEIMKFLN